jgi:hypothetical protein
MRTLTIKKVSDVRFWLDMMANAYIAVPGKTQPPLNQRHD